MGLYRCGGGGGKTYTIIESSAYGRTDGGSENGGFVKSDSVLLGAVSFPSLDWTGHSKTKKISVTILKPCHVTVAYLLQYGRTNTSFSVSGVTTSNVETHDGGCFSCVEFDAESAGTITVTITTSYAAEFGCAVIVEA